jgi:signal transduction histidine kinase
MHFGRLEHLFRTLRFRLTFWNTGMILVLLLGTLVGLRVGLRWTLQRDLDAMLSADADEAQLLVARHGKDLEPIAEELERKALTHTRRMWFARLFDSDGRVLWATNSVPDLPPPPLQAAERGPVDLGEYRLTQRVVGQPERPDVVVRVGCTRRTLDEDVLRLSGMLVVAGLVILLVAPLGGFFLAGRATRPLRVILDTTARLRPDRLVERLPLRGSGDELDRLSATINGLLDRLAVHLGRQREFVANAAHELRSPLAAMRTTVEVALAHDRKPEEYRDVLADLAEGCTALGGLVNQLLLLAEGDAGMLPAATVTRLDRLTARSAEMFRGVAETRGITLQVGELAAAPVRGTDTHLREVVNNLLDNALKFTPAGGTVTLSLQRLEGEGGPGRARLQVCDTGCGIAAADLPHVFDRFFRADKSRRREGVGGNGLGLSICQAIVTSCGGRIDLASHEGAGTTATVVMPLADGPG